MKHQALSTTRSGRGKAGIAGSALFGIVLAAILFVGGCAGPLNPNVSKESGGGSGRLRLAITQGASAQTVLPDIDMTPASYSFSGSGPGGATFSVSPNELPSSVSGLAAGAWTVTAEAKNQNGVLIARGQSSVTVDAGATRSVSLTVKPIEGWGSVEVAAFWPESQTQNPSVTAELVPAEGSVIDLSPQVSSGSANVSSTTVATGYYTLVLQIRDGGSLVMGAVESVRVVDSTTTNAEFDFESVNMAGGSLIIEADTQQPIDVAMYGARPAILPGSTMTVHGAVPSESDNVVYAWYVNGVAKSVGPSYTLGSELPSGTHRLDVTALTADGTRGGSTSYRFSVDSSIESDVTVAWDANAESDLAGYNVHWGTESGNYTDTVDVGNTTTYTIDGLDGLDAYMPYYVSATAYDVDGEESTYSQEIVGVPAASRIDPAAISASGNDGNVAANVGDDDLATRWSAEGDGEWIEFNLGSVYTVRHFAIAFYQGSSRVQDFDIEVSTDGDGWISVYSGQGSGTTSQPEGVVVPPASARFVRIVGHGNSLNMWNSITEVDIFGWSDSQ